MVKVKAKFNLPCLVYLRGGGTTRVTHVVCLRLFIKRLVSGLEGLGNIGQVDFAS